MTNFLRCVILALDFITQSCDKNMAKDLIKKIDTFRSGPFIFSRKYSSQKLSELLIEAKILYRTIADLPILPDMSSKLEEEVIRRSIFGTAAIEGNPLTEEEVANVLAQPEEGKTLQRAEREIQNLKNTYKVIKGLKLDEEPALLNKELICKIHKLITEGVEDIKNTPGQYRDHDVKVGDADHGGVYKPPKIFEDIETLMTEFILWINDDEVLQLDEVLRAALAHYHLGLIHPFGNGNGRTARAVEAIIMRWAGIKYAPEMLSNYYYQHVDEYFWAFTKSLKNEEKDDVTPFLEFVLKGLIQSLKEVKERVTGFIRVFTLRTYFDLLKTEKKITQRQNDLLFFLLEAYEPFILEDLFKKTSLSILYRQVSERTARRDIEKLSKMELLSKTKDGKYILNLRVLG